LFHVLKTDIFKLKQFTIIKMCLPIAKVIHNILR